MEVAKLCCVLWLLVSFVVTNGRHLQQRGRLEELIEETRRSQPGESLNARDIQQIFSTISRLFNRLDRGGDLNAEVSASSMHLGRILARVYVRSARNSPQDPLHGMVSISGEAAGVIITAIRVAVRWRHIKHRELCHECLTMLLSGAASAELQGPDYSVDDVALRLMWPLMEFVSPVLVTPETTGRKSEKGTDATVAKCIGLARSCCQFSSKSETCRCTRLGCRFTRNSQKRDKTSEWMDNLTGDTCGC